MGDFGTVAALVCAATWAVALCIYDFRWQRLPNFLTLPAAAGAVVAAALWAPEALWGLAWPLLYVALALAQPHGAVGGGDIKLAATLGPVVQWAGGFLAVVLAIGCAAALTLVGAVGWHLVVRTSRVARGGIPHGPSMIIATVSVMAAVLMA